jgi:transcriptional regulator with XRE-family HTH domain
MEVCSAMPFAQNLKKIRSKRKLSLAALSRLSSVSSAMLCKIEHGEKVPTIRVAQLIADALSLPLSTLLEDDTPASSLVIIRKQDRRLISDPSTHIEGQLLSPYPQSGVFFMYVPLLPHTTTGSILPASPVSQYNLVVAAGRLEFVLSGQETVSLAEGDAVFFKPEISFEVVNPTAETASYYLVANHIPCMNMPGNSK